MPGSPQSDSSVFPDPPGIEARAELSDTLQESELDAALQLLVERAQYITGATGTALALPQDDEMVCRASAGACAPAVGARLQVRSGLTGESIARRQLLRCDNAETDPRVNLETCRALGIASIVVLPLMRRNGEVRGLFELFSDHPYAFEERDLVALERMAALTLTALDLAEQRQDLATPPKLIKQSKPSTASPPAMSPTKSEMSQPETAPGKPIIQPKGPPPPTSVAAESAEVTLAQGTPPIKQPSPESPTEGSARTPALNSAIPEAPTEPPPVPEAMLRIQKCASCGFPVSEGRMLCLDCESLEKVKIDTAKKTTGETAPEGFTQTGPVHGADLEGKAKVVQIDTGGQPDSDDNAVTDDQSPRSSDATPPAEILPPFLTNPQLTEESWLTGHVNLLAFVVLLLAVLVAIVVFFR